MGKVKELKAKRPKKAAVEEPASINLNFDDGRGHVGQDNEFRDLLEAQKAAFRAKFGRDFKPRDPLFFDPDRDEPVLIPREKLPPEISAFFEQATIYGALVYAQVKVGYFLSPLNFDVASDGEVSAWDEAVREFAYLKGVV
jgi:hypothetical protein